MYKYRGAKRYWNTGSIRINTYNSRKLFISYSTYLQMFGTIYLKYVF